MLTAKWIYAETTQHHTCQGYYVSWINFELQYFCGFIARTKMMKSLELEALWTFIMVKDEVQILYTRKLG